MEPRGEAVLAQGSRSHAGRWRQGACQPFPQPSCRLPEPPAGTAQLVRGGARDTRWEPGAATKQELRACLPSATLVHAAFPATCHKHTVAGARTF